MARKFGWHSGILYAAGAKIRGDLLIQDNLIFGDVSFGKLVVKGRMVTGSASGTAIDIDANYSYGQGHELRWTISSWSGSGNSFDGMYIRAQSDIANASGNIRGLQVFGVGNDVDTLSILGMLVYAYVKGTTGKTVGAMYAIQPELSWDLSSNTCILSTEAICVRAKVTGGKVDDYAKIHGYQLKLGDMNGGSRLYGHGIWLLDDADMTGTSTLTTGLNIAIGCTTGISITGDCTTGIAISGTTANAIAITAITSTATDGMCLKIGEVGAPIDFSTATDRSAVKIYTTGSSTGPTSSVEPFYVQHTMTGTNGAGGRARFHLEVEAQQGSWINALKATTTFNDSGSVSGLASCFCADLNMSTSTTNGVYAVYEANINGDSGDDYGNGNTISFFHCNVGGTDKDAIDGEANLFHFGEGLDIASGKFIDTNKTGTTRVGGIRIYIAGTGVRWIPVFSD